MNACGIAANDSNNCHEESKLFLSVVLARVQFSENANKQKPKLFGRLCANTGRCGLGRGDNDCPAHLQGIGGMMGSAKEVAAATVTNAEIVSYFLQMSDELDRQNTISPAKNPMPFASPSWPLAWPRMTGSGSISSPTSPMR